MGWLEPLWEAELERRFFSEFRIQIDKSVAYLVFEEAN